MIELKMTAEQTADFHGLEPVSHASPWGGFRIRAQRRANDSGERIRIVTQDGVAVCTVEPIDDKDLGPDPLGDWHGRNE